ncbi:FAD:protein FMN transferase [Buchnera aphidicola]|uniref:FAD:protein FMN transferase n=1 Tax=Buchnera aphidicola TaxID=9 RepID=UPI0034648336
MGTNWKITIPKCNLHNQSIKNIKKVITNKLNKYEQKLSSWNNKSFVSIFNKYKARQPKLIDNDLEEIISMGIKIEKKTHGALDIFIGSLINKWGFGPIKKAKKYLSEHKIKKILNTTGIKYIQLVKNISGTYIQKSIPNLQINLSTMGEGFAADQLNKFLKQKKIQNYTITIGGVVIGKTNQKKNNIPVAILAPINNKNIVYSIINLKKGKAISTSGTYRNYYKINKKNISHLINPITGKPINNSLVSVSVIANSALEADAWDTALMVLGLKEAKKIAILEKLSVYFIIKKNNHFYTWYSPQFKQFLF